MIKNVIFNKTKNASVRFFIYMSSMCVLFTAFEVPVLKLQKTSPKSDLRSTRTVFRERLICDAFPIKKSSIKSYYIFRIFA